MFSEVEPKFAGRFRTEGDGPIAFGGEGRHKLIAEPVTEIAPRLRERLTHLPLDQLRQMTKREIAHAAAVFLEDFFRIHPFVDGNGRIGRMFVTLLIARESGRYRLEKFDNYGRKYRRALEIAHLHARRSDHSEKRDMRNPYWLLELVLEGAMVEVPEDLAEEPPECESVENSSSRNF